jgi:hypothetical protein
MSKNTDVHPFLIDVSRTGIDHLPTVFDGLRPPYLTVPLAR